MFFEERNIEEYYFIKVEIHFINVENIMHKCLILKTHRNIIPFMASKNTKIKINFCIVVR